MPTVKETVRTTGDKVLTTIKNLIKEGNVRSIQINGKDGKTIARFPLTIGVLGVALAPVFAAIGAIAALVTECSITIEKEEVAKKSTSKKTSKNSSSS